MAQNKQLTKEMFDVYIEKCQEFTAEKKLDSTQECIKEIDNLLLHIQDSTYFYKAELIKGTYLTAKSEYKMAMNKLLKATSFFKSQKDSVNYYHALYKVGVCYYYVNRRDEVKEIMLEIVSNNKYVSDKMLASSLSNLGAIDIELWMFSRNDVLIKEAKTYLKRAIALNIKNNRFSRLASNYSLLSELYNQIDNKKRALVLIDSALFYAKKDTNISQEGFASIKKAHILTKKKEYYKALQLINRSIEIHQNHLPTLIYAYVEKKKTLIAMKDYKNANIISDSIYQFSIKNFDKRFADGISEMNVKYSTAEKEREILIQRAKLAEKGLLIQKRNYQLTGIIVTAILIALIAYLLLNQQKIKNKQLVKENKLKVALKEIETQNKLQEQRLRISRDLHDNIGAQLSFVISSIDNLKYVNKNSTEEFKEKLSYISNFTSSTIDQLRDTIWAMNKNEISLIDLHSRVLAFVEKAKQAYNDIDISITNSIKTEISFTSIKGMNIFRVIQEAINNSLKYASASKISIEFYEELSKVILVIKDNGKGFDIEAVELGNGLQNMQDRIDEIQAKIDINSELNQGTSICITCKIDNTNKV